jgi:hypothetical protein
MMTKRLCVQIGYDLYTVSDPYVVAELFLASKKMRKLTYAKNNQHQIVADADPFVTEACYVDVIGEVTETSAEPEATPAPVHDDPVPF